MFAVKAAAEYQTSATYDDVLDIGCRVARIGRSSMQFRLGSSAEPSSAPAGSWSTTAWRTNVRAWQAQFRGHPLLRRCRIRLRDAVFPAPARDATR